MTAYASGLHLIFKGFNYVADIYGSFAESNENGAAQFNGIKADNANAVAVTIDWGIDAENNTVYDDTGSTSGFTESDANWGTTVADAESAGLSVLVRPLIDFLPKDYEDDPNPKNGAYYNGAFRNDYNPGTAGSAGVISFFNSYTSMIVEEAKVAQKEGAQVFDIGIEIDQLTSAPYLSYWDTIISDVKAVFTGKLTYSANWDDDQGYWIYGPVAFSSTEQDSSYITHDLTTQISFWSQLDYVGIDQYAPIYDNINSFDTISNPDSVTVAELVAGWTETPQDPTVYAVTGGKSLIQYYESIAAATGKPLLFTELGYPNTNDAAEESATPGYGPDGNPDGAVADPSLQAKLYEAFFEAWEQSGNSALAGVYIWEYEPNGGGSIVAAGTPAGDYNDYVVQGYPGATQIADGFAECLCAGTRIATPAGERAVETLRPGEFVTTLHCGARRILSVRRSEYHGRFVRSNHLILPVIVQPHALGPGLPARELRVSPGHGLYRGGALVPAWRLVNGTTITQPAREDAFSYFHLELEGHELLLAEGLPVESYYDFEAAGPGALPRVERGFSLHPAQRIAAGHRLSGNVDQAGPERCSGWVRDLDDGEAPVALDILAGGRRVARVLANQFRADVRKAGLGSGCCGFDVPLPAGLRGVVEVRGAASGAAIGIRLAA
jgi:hypothetical protein